VSSTVDPAAARIRPGGRGVAREGVPRAGGPDPRRGPGWARVGRERWTTALLSATTLVATLLGGILGVGLRSGWSPRTPVLLLVLGLVGLTGLAVVHAQPRSGSPSPQPGAAEGGGGQSVAASPRDAPPRPGAGMGERPSAPDGDQVTVALPVPSDQWWGRGTPVPRAGAAATTAEPVNAPDLETYLQTSIVAQCPRCAAFRLDVDASPPGYRFECRACGCRWEWQPGQPWPSVHVSPRRRGPDPRS
jgi:hypothetical protein